MKVTLTVAHVARRVERIRRERFDEVAHIREKWLWELVLDAIANGTAEDPAAVARAALESKKIEFSRWYA